MDQSLLHIVEGAPKTKEAWEHLQKKFGEKRNDISKSTMSHEVNPAIVVEDRQIVSEPHYKNAPMDDEEVNEEKEDK